MSNEATHYVELTDEQVSYLRILVAGDVCDRTRELRQLHDPKDPDRFANMRREADEAIRTGSEIIGKLPPKKIATATVVELPSLLRKQAD